MKNLYCGFCKNKLKISSKLFQSYICNCNNRKYYIAFLTKKTIQFFNLIFEDNICIMNSSLHINECIFENFDGKEGFIIQMNWKNFIENDILDVKSIRNYIDRYLELRAFE